MEHLAIAEPRQVNHEFLDAVELEIDRALRRATELEAGLAVYSDAADNSWHDSLNRMSDNLVSWQQRLGEIGRQTAAIESDLNEQEHAMRGWLQAMVVTSDRLASAARR